MSEFKREPSYTNKKGISIAKKMGKRYTLADAIMVGKKIGIDWKKSEFKPADLLVGMHYELEHGKVDARTNVTSDSRIKTAKIAWAHLNERPDYYVQLAKIDPPHGAEKKASEILNEMAKKAGYLHPINCEKCGYSGKPDWKGECPVCKAQEGKKPKLNYEKQPEDQSTYFNGNTIEEEAVLSNMMENLTAY